VHLRCASPASPGAVQEWGEDVVGEGRKLLTQTKMLRVACVGLTPDPGSCWVPEATGKYDQRLGDVTRVCLCCAPGAVSPAAPWDGRMADRDLCLPVASLAAPSRQRGALAAGEMLPRCQQMGWIRPWRGWAVGLARRKGLQPKEEMSEDLLFVASLEGLTIEPGLG